MEGSYVIILACIFSAVQCGYIPYYPDSIGTPCEYDRDCLIVNSYCKEQRKCDCMRGFQFDESDRICFPTELGVGCAESNDCRLLKNAMCIDSKCVCGPTTIQSPDNKSCLPLSRLLGTCSMDLQCIQSTPHSHCNISSQTCDCDPMYHQTEESMECIQNMGLGAMCQSTKDCYIDQDHVGKLECVSADNNQRKCACKEAYEEENGKCTNGSAHAVVSSAILALVVIVRRIF